MEALVRRASNRQVLNMVWSEDQLKGRVVSESGGLMSYECAVFLRRPVGVRYGVQCECSCGVPHTDGKVCVHVAALCARATLGVANYVSWWDTRECYKLQVAKACEFRAAPTNGVVKRRLYMPLVQAPQAGMGAMGILPGAQQKTGRPKKLRIKSGREKGYGGGGKRRRLVEGVVRVVAKRAGSGSVSV